MFSTVHAGIYLWSVCDYKSLVGMWCLPMYMYMYMYMYIYMYMYM